MAEQRQVPPAEGEVLLWEARRDDLGRWAWRLVNQFGVERGRVTQIGVRWMARTAARPVLVSFGSSVEDAQGLVWAAVTGVSE